MLQANSPLNRTRTERESLGMEVIRLRDALSRRLGLTVDISRMRRAAEFMVDEAIETMVRRTWTRDRTMDYAELLSVLEQMDEDPAYLQRMKEKSDAFLAEVLADGRASNSPPPPKPVHLDDLAPEDEKGFGVEDGPGWAKYD